MKTKTSTFFSFRLAGFAIAAWVLFFTMSKRQPKISQFFGIFKNRPVLKVIRAFRPTPMSLLTSLKGYVVNNGYFYPLWNCFNAFMKMHLPTHTRRSRWNRGANTKTTYNCKEKRVHLAPQSKCVLPNERIWLCLMVPRYWMIPMLSNQQTS